MAHHHLHGVHGRAAEPQNQVVQVVYVTAAPTFDGPIGGYITMGAAAGDPALVATPHVNPPVAVASPKPDLLHLSPFPLGISTTLGTTTKLLPTAILVPSTTLGTTGPLLAATSPPSFSSSKASSPYNFATPAANSSDTTSSVSAPSGMSTGGKAGLTIGIILLIATMLSLMVFYLKKRKDKMEEVEAAADREKAPMDGAAAAAAAAPGPKRSSSVRAQAPRLSLRPVTEFQPNLGEKSASRGNPLAAALPPVPELESENEKQPPTTGNSANPANPFGNHAEVAPAQNPFGPHAETIDTANANGPAEIDTPTLIAAMPAPATGGLKRAASERETAPKLDLTVPPHATGPPSPSGTEFSATSIASGAPSPAQTAAGAAIAAAGGPTNSAVHRVQLDFTPSMEDELELKQGSLVRVLHEYDDGWALCIKLDRSKQGVVPRTCLSTRPVKPRPRQQPPTNNGQRGPPPSMRGPASHESRIAPAQDRPSTPNGRQARPVSPAQPATQPERPTTSASQQSRPASRAGSTTQRVLSTASSVGSNPQQLSRASSSASHPSSGPNPREAPPRKPVPGQAL